MEGIKFTYTVSCDEKQTTMTRSEALEWMLF